MAHISMHSSKETPEFRMETVASRYLILWAPIGEHYFFQALLHHDHSYQLDHHQNLLQT